MAEYRRMEASIIALTDAVNVVLSLTSTLSDVVNALDSMRAFIRDKIQVSEAAEILKSLT